LFQNFGTNVVVIGEQQGQRTFQLTLNDVEKQRDQSRPFLDQRNVRVVWQVTVAFSGYT